MHWRKALLLLLVLLIPLWFFTPSVYALSMTIEAPTQQLVRGQEYDFVVSIDTFNQAITTTQGRVTYETQYLEFVSLTKGNFFESVTYDEATTGEIIVTGTNTSAKSGSGTFAIIRFKLIATAAGSTTLCAVAPITPTNTPVPSGPTNTPVPQQSCSLSCTSNANCAGGLSCINGMCLNATCPAETDCICPLPTKAPIPTAIPTSGISTGWKVGSIVALGLIGLGVLGVILL